MLKEKKGNVKTKTKKGIHPNKSNKLPEMSSGIEKNHSRKQKSSWQNYLRTISPSTALREVWNKNKSILGAVMCQNPSVIFENIKIITNQQDIIDAIGEKFKHNLSHHNYSPEFLAHKIETENSTRITKEQNNDDIHK